MDSAKIFFDGIFSYIYSDNSLDDSEIFPLIKAGINNLNSKKDRDKMYEYFKQRYINVWLDMAKEDNAVDMELEKEDAEDSFEAYWKKAI